jgi:tetratricopeptide (TPR) repeat protein
MECRNGRWLIVLLLAAATSWACSRTAKSYYDSGNQYYDQKKYKEAIVEYRNAIRKDLKFGEAHYRLAESLNQTGDLNGAFKEYQYAADLLPANKEAQLKAGVFLLWAQQFVDAEARADAALKLDKEYVEALILRANAVAQISKDIGRAIKDIEDARRIDPNRSGTYVSLGGFEHAAGDTRKAEEYFKTALALAPSSVEANLALANFYWATDRRAEVEPLLKKVADLDPNNRQATLALALYYVWVNRPADAEPYFKAAAESDWRAALTLADYYVDNNRVPEAVALLEKTAKESKEKGAYAEAQTRLAAIQYTMQKKPAEAHQTIAEVLKREPNSVAAMLLDARLLALEKNFSEAIEQAKKAVAAEPNNAAAHFTLGTIFASRNELDEAVKEYNETLRISPRAAAALAELARLSLARGSVDAAVQYAQQAAQNDPRNPQVRLRLVRALLARFDSRRASGERGDLSAAESELTPLAAEFPNEPAVQAELGNLLLRKNDLAAARKTFDKVLQLDPASHEALLGLVTLDVAEKKLPSARARLDARLAKDPNDRAALLLSARLYVNSNELVKAEQAFLKLIDVDPGELQAYQALGRIYLSQHKNDQALAKFEELAKRQPKPVAAQTMIAMILQQQGKVDEAQKRYELVLEIDPRAAVAANNLAWLYAEGRGSLDTALQLARTAKEQLPDYAQVNDTLGWIYVKKELPSLAVPLLKDAIAKEPKTAVFHYHLGVAYAKIPDKANAKASLEQALRLDPNFEGSAEARKTLASLGS